MKEVIDETADVKTFRLAPESGQIFDFKPGQFVNLAIQMREGPVPFLSKPYSISSPPTNRNYLALTIKITDREGSFPKLVAMLKPGDRAFIMGPFGVFFFDEAKYKDVMMIAGGVGITPFHSMIAYATDKKLSNKLTLMYSNKLCADIIFHKEFTALQHANPNFKFICTATREEGTASLAGVETGRFDAARIKAACGGSIEGKYFMLCGSTPFVQGFKELLETKGVPKDHLLYELFGSGV